tara:strand:- start:73 stop:477 length:405 start_codon:yes stop_codon:yes gene_type:complete
MGNFNSKNNLKRYKKIENLSLIDNDETLINEIDLKVQENQNNISQIDSKLNDFNKNISTNFNLIQNDLKALYQEVLILKSNKSTFSLSNSVPNLSQNRSFDSYYLPSNNTDIPEHLFSSIQSEKEFDNHQSLFR